MEPTEYKPDHRGTFRFNLPGGVNRLRNLVLYIAKRCQSAERFGVLKLNKIIWRADFEAYASRGVPVTGREYKRLELGPAPSEMPHVLRDMRLRREIETLSAPTGDGFQEQRTQALVEADMSLFQADDLRYVDASIDYYWDKTGIEASDDSHGAAWFSRNTGDLLPYELAHLSDRMLNRSQHLKLRSFIDDEDLFSQ